MINKINAVSNSSDMMRVIKPVFKGGEEKGVAENKELEQNNMQALTNYWVATLNLGKKQDFKPLESMLLQNSNIDTVSGERIYTSEGVLHSIVDKKEDTTTYYYPSEEDANIIDLVIVEDNKTKKEILKEYAFIEDGKISSIDVLKFSPETANRIEYTTYRNGEVDSVSRTNYLDNGFTEEMSYSNVYDEYSITREHPTKNISENIVYKNGLKNVTYYTTNEIKKNTIIDKKYEFYNGSLISMRETKEVAFPNFSTQAPLVDKDLYPHEKIDMSKYNTEAEGKRTYYSNGAIESITNDDVEIMFSPKGFVTYVKTPEFELETGCSGHQSIKEKIDENTSRETFYSSDGHVDIIYKQGDSFKKLWLDTDSKIHYYSEGKYNSEGEEIESTDYWYKNGMLKSVY